MKRNATGRDSGKTEGLQSRVETLEQQVDGLLRFFAILGVSLPDDLEPARAGRHLSLVTPR